MRGHLCIRHVFQSGVWAGSLLCHVPLSASRIWHFPGCGILQDLAASRMWHFQNVVFSRMWQSPGCGSVASICALRRRKPSPPRPNPGDGREKFCMRAKEPECARAARRGFCRRRGGCRRECHRACTVQGARVHLFCFVQRAHSQARRRAQAHRAAAKHARHNICELSIPLACMEQLTHQAMCLSG